MDPEARAAADAFGLPRDLSAQSLCKYGPVYRIADRSGDLVLKRTGYPHSGAVAIGEWLRFLKSRAIDVVAPVERCSPNPRRINGGDHYWVVYPFIPGAQFTGGEGQLEAAGSLLAAIHVEGELFVDDLMVVDQLPVHDMSWTNEHIGRATEAVKRHAPDLSDIFLERLNTRLGQLGSEEIKRTNASIRLAACSWDFKASNLVVNSDERPVLIDPDHAGRIPRIYDLACAALLFNCDHPLPPLEFSTGANGGPSAIHICQERG
jgi:Ser/Thr protein kinase RdoA (MazF antagonist)